MDIEKLYQDVWAQVFAAEWMARYPTDPMRGNHSAFAAHTAANAAIKHWSPGDAHTAIAAKGQG